MRLVATADTHYPFDASMIPDGDVFILAGDMMYEGTPAEWHARVESLAALPHKHKIFVPGNHDYFPLHYRGLASSQLRRQAGVTLHDDLNPCFEIDDVRFLAIPFVSGLPGWAYNQDEAWIYKWLKDATVGYDPDVIISHSPPLYIGDAAKLNNYGCMAFNKWFYEEGHKPSIWISGHVHESYGHRRVNNTAFYNVAMCDSDYNQSNKPMVIEV